MIPKWMEKYRSLISNETDYTLEELMELDTENVGLELSIRTIKARTQVILLYKLHEAGLLA